MINNKILNPIYKKDFKFNLDNLDESGIFYGYASIFNIEDEHNDIILPKAFEKSIKNKDNIKILWQHELNKPIGKIINIKEDSKGLSVIVKLSLEVRYGYEAYQLIKDGVIDGLSIGYNVISEHIDQHNNKRFIKEVDLWEISLVTFPANKKATINNVKNINFSEIDDFRKKVDCLIQSIRSNR